MQMFVYLVTDSKMRVHQFIYPERVWEQTEDGWVSRSVRVEDHQSRIAVCRGLVKNSISARRLMPAAPTGPQLPPEGEESSHDTIH
jgi:hypothetical protein